MDTRKVKIILDKAIQDQRFALALQLDLPRTVASYSLTREEITSVQSGLNDLITRGLVVDKNGQ